MTNYCASIRKSHFLEKLVHIYTLNYKEGVKIQK